MKPTNNLELVVSGCYMHWFTANGNSPSSASVPLTIRDEPGEIMMLSKLTLAKLSMNNFSPSTLIQQRKNMSAQPHKLANEFIPDIILTWKICIIKLPIF